MNTICASYRIRGERELVDDLSAGAHALLALVESWPHDGKLATLAGMANVHEGLRRLLAELRSALAEDDRQSVQHETA
jgi:hypothetical protein